MVKSKEFDDSLSSVERKAWRCLISVIENFLGNNRAPNYEELIKNMLDAFHEMGVNMSLKVHFLANHLDFFPENLGAFSDEHGERFHKDIAEIEKRFKGKNLAHMLAEYCWYICRNFGPEQYSRRSKIPVFLRKQEKN